MGTPALLTVRMSHGSGALSSQRCGAQLPHGLLHLRDGVSSSSKAPQPGLLTLQPWRTLSCQHMWVLRRNKCDKSSGRSSPCELELCLTFKRSFWPAHPNPELDHKEPRPVTDLWAWGSVFPKTRELQGFKCIVPGSRHELHWDCHRAATEASLPLSYARIPLKPRKALQEKKPLPSPA